MGGYRKKVGLVENIFLLHKLHKMIEIEKTGNIQNLTKILCIPHTNVLRRLNQLREMGAEIEYDRKMHTYYYKNNFKFEFHIEQ